ncbi:hypothetical protein J3E68DRAFT_355744 [Trichoderma sp. SZMC 28012]
MLILTSWDLLLAHFYFCLQVANTLARCTETPASTSSVLPIIRQTIAQLGAFITQSLSDSGSFQVANRYLQVDGRLSQAGGGVAVFLVEPQQISHRFFAPQITFFVATELLLLQPSVYHQIRRLNHPLSLLFISHRVFLSGT